MSSDTLVDIYTTPAGLPPPGQTSNLKNPYYRHTLFVVTMSLCLSISSIVVVLHIFTKSYVMKQVRPEDYALIIAQLGFIPWVVLDLVAPGQGRHLWDVSIYNAMQLAKYENSLVILYSPLSFLAKLSVLLQLQHVFVTSRRQAAFFIIQISIWVNLAIHIAYLFVGIFQCTPRAKIWDKSLPGKCISMDILFISPTAINIVSDCLILALPIIFVFRLNMALKNQLIIAAVFGSGLFTIVSDLMRLVYAIRLSRTTDIIWAVYPVAMWSAASLTTMILAATIPTMPRLCKFIMTGERNFQRHTGADRRSQPSWSRKLGRPMHVKDPITSTDVIPLGASYRVLHDKKVRPRGELEMQIMRTDSFEVTSRMEALKEGT